MLVENYGICPNCGNELDLEYNFCPHCKEKLVWLDLESYTEPLESQNIELQNGSITCSCGKNFYYETANEFVTCLYCGEKHKIVEE